MYVFLGVFLGFSTSVYALSTQTENEILDLQDSSYHLRGEYYNTQTDYKDRNITVNTYETICKGFYITEEKNDKLYYYGYGDLAERYTFNKDIIQNEKIASTTIIISTSTASF